VAELKPCPFCAHVPSVAALARGPRDTIYVACECGAEGPSAADTGAAMTAWNTRADGVSAPPHQPFCTKATDD
jgi:Lar family restriction alleviation protein